VNFLLDTSAFLWLILDDPQLSTQAHMAIRNPENGLCLSAVSMWEILVKHRLGKLPLPDVPPAYEFIREERQRHRIEPLPLSEEDTAQLLSLPDYHRDPFDRMLVCQAINGGLTILTPDKAIRQYPVRTAW
jgi:PIN domain nuclease of toxin-antitoxin system